MQVIVRVMVGTIWHGVLVIWLLDPLLTEPQHIPIAYLVTGMVD